jgi:hypothetical protein
VAADVDNDERKESLTTPFVRPRDLNPKPADSIKTLTVTWAMT